MRMLQVVQVTSFSEKALPGVRVYVCMQDFDGDTTIKIDVRGLVDISKRASSNQMAQEIISHALFQALCHGISSSFSNAVDENKAIDCDGLIAFLGNRRP
jgi:hypothetical protein